MCDADKIKHLEFIQNIIDRHNRNSFQIKFGTITVISALLAIYADKGDGRYILMCIVPLLGVAFWILFICGMKNVFAICMIMLELIR